MHMQDIIPPISRELLKQELTQDKFLRYTNFGNRLVYVVTAHDAPNIMQEVGRLREEAFRSGGGGTGKSADIDEFDIMPDPYKQLVVWDPAEEEIIGGYRFIEGNRVKFSADGKPLLSTTEIFHFSDFFLKEYLPKTIELGRSFVQPKYQSARRGIFSLDNLWDGLGGLVTINRSWMQYFFGKVTMYTSYNKEARDTLLYYVNHYHHDPENLVIPIDPIRPVTPKERLDRFFNGLNLEEAYKVANKRIRELGEKKAIHYFHAKDTQIMESVVRKNGVLDTKSFTEAGERSWIFRTLGYGHGEDLWKQIFSLLKIMGYDDSISIEHEDGLMSPKEGLEKAIRLVKESIIRESNTNMWWA